MALFDALERATVRVEARPQRLEGVRRLGRQSRLGVLFAFSCVALVACGQENIQKDAQHKDVQNSAAGAISTMEAREIAKADSTATLGFQADSAKDPWLGDVPVTLDSSFAASLANTPGTDSLRARGARSLARVQDSLNYEAAVRVNQAVRQVQNAQGQELTRHDLDAIEGALEGARGVLSDYQSNKGDAYARTMQMAVHSDLVALDNSLGRILTSDQSSRTLDQAMRVQLARVRSQVQDAVRGPTVYETPGR